jgi:hypothetical protein
MLRWRFRLGTMPSLAIVAGVLALVPPVRCLLGSLRSNRTLRESLPLTLYGRENGLWPRSTQIT